MTRRAARRRYAILGALAEHGPATATQLCQLLHRASGTLYPDLAVLEGEGRVVGKWTTGPHPRRRLYRLPTPQERADRLALEDRLRGALRAAVEPLEGERG